jgi:hypothetical protein
MADEIIVSKAAFIERCVARAREEYAKGTDSFATDYTRQRHPEYPAGVRGGAGYGAAYSQT